MNGVGGERTDVEAAKEIVLTIGNTVNNVTVSQSGCESHEDGLVMIDSEASVSDCPKWFVEPALEQSDGAVRLRGAVGRTLQEHGMRAIGLEIVNKLKRYEFHVADVTKPILSASYFGENGIESRLARQPFLKYGVKHEPLFKKSDVYFVKAEIIHQVEGAVEAVMQDHSPFNVENTLQNHVCELKGCRAVKDCISHAHELRN